MPNTTRITVDRRKRNFYDKFTKTEFFYTSTKNLFEHSKLFLNYQRIVRYLDFHPALQANQKNLKLTERTELEFLIKATGKKFKVEKFFKKRASIAERLWKTKYCKFKSTKRKPTLREKAVMQILKRSRKCRKMRSRQNCCYCRFTTWYSSAIARHKLVKHRTRKQRLACTKLDKLLAPSVYDRLKKNAKCRKCGKEFAHSDSLKKHMEVVHQKKKRYECKECGKRFGQRQDLTVHMNKHTGIKPFKCEICDKGFTSSSSRNAHVRQIHEKIKPHVCQICEKSFAQLQQLKSHTRFHTGYKPHMCKQCGYATVTSGLLLVHVRNMHALGDVTNGRKMERFTCNDCGMVFKSKELLETHSNVAKGARSYKCDKCGVGFYCQKALGRHYSKVHNMAILK